MSKEEEEHRYLFTVRQQFGEDPRVDTFYKLQVPAGLTKDQAQIFKILNENFIKDEITKDTQALQGMQLRLRFNTDMYQHVCLVRTTFKISADDLDSILTTKFKENKLIDFLNESAINGKNKLK